MTSGPAGGGVAGGIKIVIHPIVIKKEMSDRHKINEHRKQQVREAMVRYRLKKRLKTLGRGYSELAEKQYGKDWKKKFRVGS